MCFESGNEEVMAFTIAFSSSVPNTSLLVSVSDNFIFKCEKKMLYVSKSLLSWIKSGPKTADAPHFLHY